MPDELPGEEAGAVATPSEPTTDWEQRWKDTHANWNTLNERMSRFEKDPNALIEFIQEKHPDLLTEDEDEIEEPAEPDEEDRPLSRAEFKAWQAEQAQERQQQTSQQAYEADLKTFVNGRELSAHGERAIRNAPGVNGPDDLKKAVDDWFAYEDTLKGASKPKPRAPHVPANGQAATDVPDWSGMSRREIDKTMAEMALARSQQ